MFSESIDQCNFRRRCYRSRTPVNRRQARDHLLRIGEPRSLRPAIFASMLSKPYPRIAGKLAIIFCGSVNPRSLSPAIFASMLSKPYPRNRRRARDHLLRIGEPRSLSPRDLRVDVIEGQPQNRRQARDHLLRIGEPRSLSPAIFASMLSKANPQNRRQAADLSSADRWTFVRGAPRSSRRCYRRPTPESQASSRSSSADR